MDEIKTAADEMAAANAAREERAALAAFSLGCLVGTIMGAYQQQPEEEDEAEE